MSKNIRVGMPISGKRQFCGDESNLEICGTNRIEGSVSEGQALVRSIRMCLCPNVEHGGGSVQV